ncbi:hypothetical protein HXX76_006174 [Chlamydomonas incerta]|uniref:Uncharacterized protein n=1 Tax=Chlamydomonas incerta TaxID=51695 RepID=A0A835W5Q4_CHLIN|nr:hypothetical protein HXX76_006174 [Chlamydomonas incerta]|eukprot:KAG2436646.1 hypothetical protein HXX76_006174 [Chlamydomonas incerta]
MPLHDGHAYFDGCARNSVSCITMPPPHDAAALAASYAGVMRVAERGEQCMDWEYPHCQQQAPQPCHLHLQQQQQQQQQQPAGRDASQVPRLPSLATRGGSLGSRATAGGTTQGGGGGGAVPFKRPLEDSSNGTGDCGSADMVFFQRADGSGATDSRLGTAPTAASGRHSLGGAAAEGRAPLRPRNGDEPGSVPWADRAEAPPRHHTAMQQRLTAADPHQQQQQQQQSAAPFSSRQPYSSGLAPRPSSTWLPPITSAGAGCGDDAQRQRQQAPASSAALTPTAGVGSPPPAPVSAVSFLGAVANCPQLLGVLAWLLRRRLLPVPGDLVGTLAHMYLLCRRAAEGAAGAAAPAAAAAAGAAAADARGLDVAARLRDPDWMLTLLWVVESVSSQYRCQLAAEVLPSYLEAMAAAAPAAGGGGSPPACRQQSEREGDGSSSSDEDDQGPGAHSDDDSDTEYDGSCTVRRVRSPPAPLPQSLEVVWGRPARWWRRRMVANQLQLLLLCGWSVTVSSQQLAAATEELVTAERRPAAAVAAAFTAAAPYPMPPPPAATPACYPAGATALGHLLRNGGDVAELGGSSSVQQQYSQPRRPQGLARWFSSSSVAPAPPADASIAPPVSSSRPLTATRFPAASAGLLGVSNGAVGGRSITEPGCRRPVALAQGLLPSLCRALSVPSPLLAGFRRASRSTGGGGSSNGEITAVVSSGSRGASDTGAQVRVVNSWGTITTVALTAETSEALPAAPAAAATAFVGYGAYPVPAAARSTPPGVAPTNGVCELLLPLVSRLVEQASWKQVAGTSAVSKGRVDGGTEAAGGAAAGSAARSLLGGPVAVNTANTGGQKRAALAGRQAAAAPAAGGERVRLRLQVYAYEYEESLLMEQQQAQKQQAEQCAAANVWAC